MTHSPMTGNPEEESMTDRLSYRLDVIGADVADAVTGTGGWIFDRSMDGWTVTVLCRTDPTDADARALHILGAQAERITAGLAGRRPDGVAVSATVLREVPAIREQLLGLQATGSVAITVWGDDGTGAPPWQGSHRLSAAARAFKAQALLAVAGGRGPVGADEPYRRGIAQRADVENAG
ncbi:MAG: hypothetical protein U0R77_04120 [Mycolicibacterium insubricum]|nr:hypothetical protein [Mycobacterium sp.]